MGTFVEGAPQCVLEYYSPLIHVYKICVPVLRNALIDITGGRDLLCAVRAYVELDLLASFEVHTELSVKRGRKVAKKFWELAHVNSLSCPRTNVAVTDHLKLIDVQARCLELPQDAPHPTPF